MAADGNPLDGLLPWLGGAVALISAAFGYGALSARVEQLAKDQAQMREQHDKDLTHIAAQRHEDIAREASTRAELLTAIRGLQTDVRALLTRPAGGA